MNMNIEQLLNILSDLKYTQRLNKESFSQLFFPNSTEEPFLDAHWSLFVDKTLHYLWSLSGQELELLCQYVKEQKYQDGQRRYRPYLHDGGDGK